MPEHSRSAHPSGDFAPRSGPLAPANAGFHETYERLVAATVAGLGHDVPVIVMLGDDLTLLAGGDRRTEQALPEHYHQLKSIGHLVFGVLLTLLDHGSGPLSDATRAALTQRLVELDEAQAAIAGLPAGEQPTQQTLLDHARRLIETVLASQSADDGLLATHARHLGPFISRTTATAVRFELDRLHAIVTSWRQSLGRERWSRVIVVVCGRHQPRYRDVARQYFGRLLREAEGIGAATEDRILYAEQIDSVDSALDLLARHMIDQRASALLFGDRRHLQQDLLADAAAAYLDQLLGAGADHG